MPHLICKGTQQLCRGPKWTTPFLVSAKNGLPLVGGRGGGLPLKNSGTPSENQQDRPNLGLIRRTRPWAEGGGWLLTSQRLGEPEAPLLGRPVLLTFAAGKAVGRVG